MSVWVAEHRWAVPSMRLAVGLGVIAVITLVSGADLAWVKVVGFVVGVALGGEAGEREKERGDSLIEMLLSGDGLPEGPELLPREFAEYVPQPPDPRNDPRLGRMG